MSLIDLFKKVKHLNLDITELLEQFAKLKKTWN